MSTAIANKTTIQYTLYMGKMYNTYHILYSNIEGKNLVFNIYLQGFLYKMFSFYFYLRLSQIRHAYIQILCY